MSEIKEGCSMSEDLIDKVKDRNKLKRIADTLAGGLATVKEYEANVTASDPRMKIKRQAKSRHMRTAKDKSRRQHPYILDQLLLKLLLILIMSISISVRTRRPFELAAHGVSRPSTTYAMPVYNLATAGRTVHFSNATSSTSAIHNRTINKEQLVNERYLYLFSDFDSDYCLNHDVEILLRQERFLKISNLTRVFSLV
ncbi:unnamed protein product [Mytilus edulis]|uniref:Uncharacterized protein n=1 Tax=Mytilus edulis TaxID=6550 RepID=A0A8S3UYQ3_MYTED|nr:unnamed protein product [Mytilus edulis]